jgi:anti-anti-sigma factor
VTDTFLVEDARIEGVGVVRFIGELDLAYADRAKQAALRALAALNGDGSPLVFDLSDLSYCDSSGIRAFVAVHGAASRSGHEVVLRNPQPMVRRVFELCAVDSWFRIENAELQS